jgi:putative addiction module component (TIGR02574 family)
MSERSTAVLEEVLKWPSAERGDLAARLLESFDADTDADAQDAWADEIQLRIEEIRSSNVVGVPWAEARAQILNDDDNAR